MPLALRYLLVTKPWNRLTKKVDVATAKTYLLVGASQVSIAQCMQYEEREGEALTRTGQGD